MLCGDCVRRSVPSRGADQMFRKGLDKCIEVKENAGRLKSVKEVRKSLGEITVTSIIQIRKIK